MKNKLLIVDGSNLLFQMFYGMPARIMGKHGRPIHGTIGFVGALRKMIRMTAPTHVIAIFDGETHNERKDMDADYKANRPTFEDVPEEELPFSQLPDIYASLDLLGIRRFETVDCETDDLIAAYALTLGGETEIAISSFDSDFFQLITDNVKILRYRGDNTVICDRHYIAEKFGITPERYADHKALTGDSADNIKGAKGVGPKTATALIGQFGSLQNLLDNTADIAKPAIRASIVESRDRLLMNYALIKLENKFPLPYTMDQLLFSPNTMSTTDVLRAIGAQ